LATDVQLDRQTDSEGSRRILFLNFSLGTHQGKKFLCVVDRAP